MPCQLLADKNFIFAVLFVAMSLSFFCFSRIMVLDKGFVVEFDTPETLLAQQGIFYNMARDAGLA